MGVNNRGVDIAAWKITSSIKSIAHSWEVQIKVQLLNSPFSVNLWLLQFMPQRALRDMLEGVRLWWSSWTSVKARYYITAKSYSLAQIYSVPPRRLDRMRIARGIQSSVDHSSSASFCLEASATSTRQHDPKPVVPTAQQCCVLSSDTLSCCCSPWNDHSQLPFIVASAIRLKYCAHKPF